MRKERIPRSPQTPAAVFLALAFLAAAAAAQDEKPPQARVVEARVGHRAVHEIRLVKEGGGRMDAGHPDGLIAFDMLGEDGFYDVYTMKLDGVEKCITCEFWETRKVNCLAPSWHPSGKYLVMMAQENAKKRGLKMANIAGPERGLGSELWVVTADGRDYWQITRLADRGSAVLDPHFSHEASLLVWSERLSTKVAPWGDWGVRVIDFELKRRGPRTGKDRLYRPGSPGLTIAHEFTPDDRALLVSAPSAPGFKNDLLRLDLETREVTTITSAPDQSDGVVKAMPHGDYLVWTSDRGLGSPMSAGTRPLLRERNEVWLRSLTGFTQERLTYFNDPDSDHYLGEAFIDDLDWTQDGESLLVHVLSIEPGFDVVEGIYLVKLGRDYWRDPSGQP